MAIYGANIYGDTAATYYGARAFVQFSAAPFTSTSPDYGVVQLNWIVPTGNYTNFRLVRNTIGIPVDKDDGVVLIDTTQSAGITNNYRDTGLIQGKFYYYAIFVLATGTPNVWLNSASTTVLVTNNFNYATKMLNNLPIVYRSSTDEITSSDDNNVLSNFLKIFGFQLDHIRTEYDSLLSIYDPLKVAGNLLPLMVHQFGFNYETELGQKRNRVLAKNSVRIHKQRGTIPGVSLLVTTVSGWGNTVSMGVNLALDNNEASFEQSIGHWSLRGDSIVSAALSRVAAPGWQDPQGIIFSNGYLRITTGASGGAVYVASTASVGASSTAIADRLTLIPVVSGTTYTASIYVNAAATPRSNVISIDWYDINGTYLSSFGGGTPVNSVVGTWTRISATATAPANATFARATVTITGTAANEMNYLDQFQFEVGSSPTAPQYARDQRIVLYADRINEIPDPSFEGTLATWVIANAALTQSTDIAPLYGFNNGLISTTSGTVTLATPLMKVYPSNPYTGSIYLNSREVSRQIRSIISWYDNSSALISTTSLVGNSAVGTWTRPSNTNLIAPTNAAYAKQTLEIDGNLATNPDLEVNTSGWSVPFGTPGIAMARVSTYSYTGNYSLMVTTGSSGDNRTARYTLANLQPGTYTVSMWVLCPNAGDAANVRIGTEVGSAIGGNGNSPTGVPTNTWTRLSAPVTITSAGSVYVNVSNRNSAVTYIDGLQWVFSNSPGNYLPPTTSNLFSNPSYEGNFLPAGLNGTTTSFDTSQKLYGTRSLKLVGTAATVVSADQFADDRSANGAFLIAGTTYTVSAYYYTTVANNTVEFDVYYSAAYGGSLAAQVRSIGNSVANTWTRISTTFTAAVTGYAGPVIRPSRDTVNTSNTADPIWWDAIQIEAGQVATSFVDGTLGAGYTWDSSNNLLGAAASSFEDGSTGGWSGAGGCTVANSSTTALSGTNSLLATLATSAGAGTNGPSYTLSLAPNTSYSFSAYVYLPAGSVASVALSVQGAGVTSTVGGPSMSTTNAWTRMGVTFTSSAAGGSVTLYVINGAASTAGQTFYIDAIQLEQRFYVTRYTATGVANISTSTRSGEHHFVDGAMFEQSPALNTYFDASTPTNYTALTDYSWGSGGANNSPSYYYNRKVVKNSRINSLLNSYIPLGSTATLLYAQGI